MALGATQTFSSGGQSLVASGFWTSGPTQDLDVKNGGAGESGLGLATADSADHEIEANDFVQLDLMTLLSAGYHSFTVTLGSLQSGESGKIAFGASAGTLTGGTLIKTLTGGAVTQSWTFTDASTRYVDVVGGGIEGGDTILASVTASSVPDGASTALMLGGALLGLAALRRRFAR